MKIGILAVQGDYEAHGRVLAKLGVEQVFVKSRADMAGVDAIVLPGGESTTQLKFLTEEGLQEYFRELAERGGAFFGTCAGAILLAREVRNPAQASLGLADIVITRNAYGRQVASGVRAGISKLKDTPLEMVFIRAPVIEQVGPDVEVLAESEGNPVLVRQGKVLAATFHPELTDDASVHEYFLKMTSNGTHGRRKRTKVLFVCVGNTCRSQMAEALARHLASDVLEALSAGIAPLGTIIQPTMAVLKERGVKLEGQQSKGLRPADCLAADVIVNMTGRPGPLLFPDEQEKVEDWDVPDPYGESIEVYREICTEIEKRLAGLAERLRRKHAQVEVA